MGFAVPAPWGSADSAPQLLPETPLPSPEKRPRGRAVGGSPWKSLSVPDIMPGFRLLQVPAGTGRLVSLVAVKVRLSPVSQCIDPFQTGGQDWGVRVPSPSPTKTRASGVSWSSPAHRAPSRTHSSTAFPRTHPSTHDRPPPPRPAARPHPSPPQQAGSQRRGRVTHPPFFLRSLAMRSSSWRGPSGRARRRSRRGWRGCGGRSRRTSSWPSRSARLTCPPPRRGPRARARRQRGRGPGLPQARPRKSL